MAAARAPGSWRWILTGLLLLAAGVWWATLLHQGEQTVFARVPILDEVYYLDRAVEVSAGTGVAEPYFISPLYPRLIALFGSGSPDPETRVFDPSSLRGIRIFQIICWLGLAVLLRVMAGRHLGALCPAGWRREAVVWLPVVLFVLYRPAVVYTLSILLELPLAFLLTLVLFLVLDLGQGSVAPRSRLNGPKALMLGTALGLAGLLRGSALVLIPLAFVVAGRSQPGWGRRLAAVGWLVVGLLAALGPAVVHNSRLAGQLVAPTLNGGVNLYIGNGPEANGFYVAAVPGDWRRDPAGQAFLETRLGLRHVTLPEADRIWRERALEEISARPLRTAGLWLKKVWLHLQSWEIDQLAPLAGWGREAPLLGILVVPYALFGILGLTGLVCYFRRRSIRWLGLVMAFLMAGQSLFFVVSRYRLALVPVLALLAGAGLAALLNRRPRVWVISGLAVLLVIPWGLNGTRQIWHSLALANEARRWVEVSEAAADPVARAHAVDLYRQALEGPVEGPAPWLGLAALLQADGLVTEAADILTRGVEANPGHLDLAKALIAALLADGRHGEAAGWMQAVLRDHPDDADTLHNTAVLFGGSGRTEEATAVAERLVRAHPTDPRGYADWGILLARAGRPDEARRVFERGLAAVPGHAGLQKNLSLLEKP